MSRGAAGERITNCTSGTSIARSWRRSVIGFDKVYARARGAYLYDMDNQPYLDFLSGWRFQYWPKPSNREAGDP